MKRYIVYMNMLLVLLLSACSNDFFEEMRHVSSEEAVTILAEYPSWGISTRADINITIPEKENFEEGDVIHVQGDFVVEGSTVRRYDTYIYKNGKWTTNTENGGETRLKWPWNATKGTFTAYYLPGTTNTALSENGGTSDGDLGGDYKENDLLKAEAKEVLNGHAVNLTFKHLCTRLIILNTKSNYAEEYWFGRTSPVVNNAYRLSYQPDGDGLSVSFISNTETNGGAISTLKVLSGTGSGTADNAGYVVLYLQPGQYKNAELNYSDNRPYLLFGVDALDHPSTEEPNGLEAGKSYILDIKKASGIVDREVTEDPWGNPDPLDGDFSVQNFLNAIQRGEEYTDDNGHEILKKNAAGHLVLMKNLDFRNSDYDFRNVPANITFDGNYHYIINTKHAVFFQIEGNVRNLEIRNTNIVGFADDTAFRAGALARINNGNIDNIRLRDLSITVPGLVGTERTMSVGGLVGEFQGGLVSNIQIIGTHNLTINDPEGGIIDGHVILGGVIGQATAGTAIRNVSMVQDENGNDPVITITLNTQGQSTATVGGIVGATSVSMENCTYMATVDCSKSKVLGCGAGGLFGREISGDTGKEYTISNCNVSGKVKGPFCNSVTIGGSKSLGRSSVGGIGGGVQGKNVTFTNCNTFCEVYDYFNGGGTNYTTGHVDADDVYATGGAFGRFTSGNARNQVHNCTAWGKVNATPITGQTYIGSFIGYTKADEYNLGTNRINDTANNGLPARGGAFKGAD